MKKILFCLASICMFISCQNELYKDPLDKKYDSAQGAFINGQGTIQVFVEEGVEVPVNDVVIGLVKPSESETNVLIKAGDSEQLERFNAKNHTEYQILPEEMYSVSDNVNFESKVTSQKLNVTLKNVKFTAGINYALPVRISGGDVNGVPGEMEALIVLEQRIRTKCLKMNGSGTESNTMWPEGIRFGQWTFEAMVKRSAYSENNQSIGGTKTLANTEPRDEIFTRFGDVTIDPNQLQIKTGASQIDVDKEKFAAKPDEWYMLTFVYDGKKHYVYVNGEQVAEAEIRDGEYNATGFWIGGRNEYIREYRFWKVARTPKQIKEFVWKMVDYTDTDLLCYYPCNGKKLNEDGTIVEDETKVWDWSTYRHHLNNPPSSFYDDNDGDMFVFPLQK